MNLFTTLLIAVLIILVLIVIYYFWRKKGNDTKKGGAGPPLYESLLQSSTGSYDNFAQRAMEELRTRRGEADRAEELFRQADIMRHNYFGNEWRRLRAEPNLVGDIARNYQAALRNIRAGNVAGGIPVDFMIGQIETFAAEGIQELGAARPNLGGAFMFMGIDDIQRAPDAQFEMLMPLLEGILAEVPATRATNIEQRRREARNEAENKLEAVTTFLEKSQTHTNDGQNVHDPTVNISLKTTLDRIKKENRGNERLEDTEFVQDQFSYRAEEVLKSIRLHLPDIAKKEGKTASLARVLRVLDHILKTRAFVSAIGDKEDNVLIEIWKRANDPRNMKNHDKIKLAIYDALADMGDPADQSIVCCNGRAGRILEALTLLDFDQDVGRAQTTETYRNEIFNDVKRAIDAEIERATEDNDVCIKAAARGYTEKLSKEEQKLAADGEEGLKARLVLVIDSIIQTYANKMRGPDLEQVRQECMAAI